MSSIDEQLESLIEEVKAMGERIQRCEAAWDAETARARALDSQVENLSELVEDAKPLVAELSRQDGPMQPAAIDWIRRWRESR